MHVEQCQGIFSYISPHSIHTHPKLSGSCLKQTTLRDWLLFSVALGQDPNLWGYGGLDVSTAEWGEVVVLGKPELPESVWAKDGWGLPNSR